MNIQGEYRYVSSRPEEHVRLCSHLQHSYTKTELPVFIDGKLLTCKGFGVVGWFEDVNGEIEPFGSLMLEQI